MQEFFAGGSVQERSVPNAQIFDWDGLVGRLRSSSYAPQEGQPNYAPMMAALEELFRANQDDGRREDGIRDARVLRTVAEAELTR